MENEMLLKLGISAVLGLIIGIERELKRKPVGLKTSLVISIISCLLCALRAHNRKIVCSYMLTYLNTVLTYYMHLFTNKDDNV